MVRRSEVYLLHPVSNPYIIPLIPAAKKMSCSKCGRSSARSLAEARSKPVGTLARAELDPGLSQG